MSVYIMLPKEHRVEYIKLIQLVLNVPQKTLVGFNFAFPDVERNWLALEIVKQAFKSEVFVDKVPEARLRKQPVGGWRNNFDTKPIL